MMSHSPDGPFEPRPPVDTLPAKASSGRSLQNMDTERSKLTQTVDTDARCLARDLLRSAREAALAVLRPGDGYPAASRVLVATDFVGRPILLLSGLSPHARALGTDRRCSLLVGRSGKGDPLAHPRMTLFADAHRIEPDDPRRASLRERILARHPKAEFYVDFPDFFFVRLEPIGASLNGGFAQAFDLRPDDLVDAAAPELEASASRARDHMNAHHIESIDEIATMIGCEGTGWRIATMDSRGCEIALGDLIRRIEFPQPADLLSGGFRSALRALVAKSAGP